MNFKKTMILIALILGMNNQNILAMEQTDDQCTIKALPYYDLEYILDFLYQPNQQVPVSYLHIGQELTAFSRVSHACRNLSLLYTENGVINRLLRFDKSKATSHLDCKNEVDFVSACCAFKIISRIREIGVDDYGRNFCDPQFQALRKFFNETRTDIDKPETTTFFKKMLLSPIEWIKSKIKKSENHFLAANSGSRYDKIFRAIQSGENVDQQDAKIGGTALFPAVAHNDVCVVRLFLAAGADVNASCSAKGPAFEWTALQLAVQSGSADVISILVLAGADANARAKDSTGVISGVPLLSLVVLLKNTGHMHITVDVATKIITDLVAAGADVNMPVIGNANTYLEKTTALCLAARFNDLKMVRLLLQLGANPTTVKFDAMVPDSLEEIQLFLEQYNTLVSSEAVKPEIRQIIQEAHDSWILRHATETK